MEPTDAQKLLIGGLKVLGFGVEDVIDICVELRSDIESLEMMRWLGSFIDQGRIPTSEQVMSKAHEIAFIYKASLS